LAIEREPGSSEGRAATLRAVIFDLFGVLTRAQSRRAVSRMARTLRVGGSTFQVAYWAERPEYDRGVLSGHEYWERVARSLGREIGRDEIDGLIELDVDSWDRPEPSMVEFARAIARSDLAVAILSNSPQEITERFRSYPWIADFDPSIFSSEVGSVKPEPAIFDRVIVELDVDVTEAVLIDDRAENIAAAQSHGLRGFVFRTGETTPSDLAAFLGR